MIKPNLSISSAFKLILVNLPGKITIEHRGSALVDDGHLYLRGDPLDEGCQTYAVYAPGQWHSVQAIKGAGSSV